MHLSGYLLIFSSYFTSEKIKGNIYFAKLLNSVLIDFILGIRFLTPAFMA